MIKTLFSTSASFATLFQAIGAIFTLIASCFESAPVQTQSDYLDDDTIGSRYGVDNSRYYNYGNHENIIPYREANGAIIALRRKSPL